MIPEEWIAVIFISFKIVGEAVNYPLGFIKTISQRISQTHFLLKTAYTRLLAEIRTIDFWSEYLPGEVK